MKSNTTTCSSQIDLAVHEVIPLSEVPRWLPERNGKSLHVNSVHRWTRDGVGGVVLESWMIGGIRCTTLNALHEFIARRSGLSPEFVAKGVRHRGRVNTARVLTNAGISEPSKEDS